MRRGRAKGGVGRAVTGVVLLAVAGGLVLPSAASASGGARRGGGDGGDSQATRSLDGVWRMDGYGTVVTVRGGAYQEYQTTAVSCLRGEAARRAGHSGGAYQYAKESGRTFSLRQGARPHRMSLHVDGSPGDRELRRVGELPAGCDPDGDDGSNEPFDPLRTFDVFWHSFAENYPFFAAKGIDWEATRDTYRPRVDADTSRDELFGVFRDMVRPLHDAHVSVEAGATGRFFAVRPGTTMPDKTMDARVTSYIEDRDLGGRPLTRYAGGRIGYADLPGGRGYLRISGFLGYSETPTYEANKVALDQALNAILTAERTRKLRGLVIDLRVNGGGADSFGLQLASRLTDRPYFAYAKRARNDPSDPTRFTAPQPQYVTPARAPRYGGPIAVLTGGSTISAGETFTQALMDRPGQTVRIGEHTQGVFSDTLERDLPGGWRVNVPNEEFRTRSGQSFDGPGIPPHLYEPVFTEEEFAHRRDSAFDRALRVLPGAAG
ncbi:S41 family peptidase [Streptomyces buecherae]|uniref:S41 family peptidase n=1 Tax=Streptomyces buecherae TaxID=2763006 RepID=UPI003F541720